MRISCSWPSGSPGGAGRRPNSNLVSARMTPRSRACSEAIRYSWRAVDEIWS